MNIQRSPQGEQRGYFALSIALLLTAVTSLLVLNLGANLSRMEAESILIEERENYAMARQLEAIVHASLQRTIGQEAYYHDTATDVVTEINDRLTGMQLPPNSTLHLLDATSVQSLTPVAFYPQSRSRTSRIPISGKVPIDDLPFGAAASFLHQGYYVSENGASPSSIHFGCKRSGEINQGITIDVSFREVALTSQRLVLYTTEETRPLNAPQLDQLDDSLGFLITRHHPRADGGEIIDDINLLGSQSTTPSYRHRAQVTEALFPYLFHGPYLEDLEISGQTTVINVSSLPQAVEDHDGLFTQEQEDTPPGDPIPPVEGNSCKMDISRFPGAEVLYLKHPYESIDITFLESQPSNAPLMIVVDGGSGPGDFTIGFEEVITRPVLYVLTSTTVTFSGSTQGVGAIPSGAIAGAFLLDDHSFFQYDYSSAQNTRVIYGTILGPSSLLERAFVGFGNHPTPVLQHPAEGYYEALEEISPRVLLVDTKSTLNPIGELNP